MGNPQKEVKQFVRAAKKQGWRVKKTTNGYLLLDATGQQRSAALIDASGSMHPG